MRIKLGLLSTVIALVCGQVYSSDMPKVTEKTQETSSSVADEANKCKEHLQNAISIVEEFSASCVAFSETLQASYFEGIDEVLNTQIENSKVILGLGTPLFEINKTLAEVYEKYKVDNSEDLKGKINESREKLMEIAKSVKSFGDTLDAQKEKIPSGEYELRNIVLKLQQKHRSLDSEIMRIDHSLEMLGLTMNLERWDKLARELTVPVTPAEPIKVAEKEDGPTKLDKEIEEFEKKLLKTKSRRASSPGKPSERVKSRKARPYSADAADLAKLEARDGQKEVKIRKRKSHSGGASADGEK